jgi:NAD(P) transhydrogenase subunit alpha
MSAEYQAKQQALVSEHIASQDIVVTTALIPGRPAPRLVSMTQVAAMRPGSVVVDLAVEQGGNVEGARAEEIVVTPGGVAILGFANLPARVAADASALYSRNLEAFVRHLTGVPSEAADADEILGPARVVGNGKVLFAPALVPTT